MQTNWPKMKAQDDPNSKLRLFLWLFIKKLILNFNLTAL